MNHSCYARVRWPARQSGAALVVGLVLLVVITLVGVGAMQNTTLQEKMAGNLRDSNLAFQASEVALRDCEAVLVRDYRLQIDRFNGVAPYPDPPANPAPPAPPLRDLNWCLGDRPPTDASCWSAQTAWLWSLDEDQAANFPGAAGNRLDPATGDNQFWWTARNLAWWQSAASNSRALPANTLEGLFDVPRCLLEGYAYGNADNSLAAQAFRQKARHIDGVVDRPEALFRRESHYFRVTSRGVGGSDTAVSMLQTTIYRIYWVPKPS
jgi:Tfp pilus assembly protein PilX